MEDMEYIVNKPRQHGRRVMDAQAIAYARAVGWHVHFIGPNEQVCTAVEPCEFRQPGQRLEGDRFDIYDDPQ